MRSTLFPTALLCLFTTMAYSQDCEQRSFIINTSFDESGFTVQTFQSDLLDSLYWDFGDGNTLKQTSNVGTGAAGHTYSAPGTYNVTLERWGVKDFPENTTPLHCLFTLENVIYPDFTDSICGGDFLMFSDGNTVTFSNTSVIQSPAFNAHSTEPLWDFGNGMNGIFINRIYTVPYAPGTYTACLYYGGFSFPNGGYLFDCSTCRTFTVGAQQGIEDLSTAHFNLYPDPAENFIEITADQIIDIREITVLDQSGRSFTVPIDHRTTSGARLNVEHLAAGMYMLRVNTTRTVPFIKL